MPSGVTLSSGWKTVSDTHTDRGEIPRSVLCCMSGAGADQENRDLWSDKRCLCVGTARPSLDRPYILPPQDCQHQPFSTRGYALKLQCGRLTGH
ncbi:hypothetical protein FKM82_028918 [Ascaphus truei]